VISLPRRLAAELLGTLLLVCMVVGSGVAASRLSPNDVGLQLLENALATALGLFVLIAVLAPLSGAHLNPVVSLVDAALGRRRWADASAYLPAQFVGGILGAVLANLMFGLPAITISSRARFSTAHALSEVVATAGLVIVIFVLARTGRDRWAPAAVGAWIGAAYFFTSSTSFANPAVTIGRVFSNSFAGIAPLSAWCFLGAQLVGALLGYAIIRILTPRAIPS
jgi:glycerol uptake facilitator-like aquaporin